MYVCLSLHYFFFLFPFMSLMSLSIYICLLVSFFFLTCPSLLLYYSVIRSSLFISASIHLSTRHCHYLSNYLSLLNYSNLGSVSQHQRFPWGQPRKEGRERERRDTQREEGREGKREREGSVPLGRLGFCCPDGMLCRGDACDLTFITLSLKSYLREGKGRWTMNMMWFAVWLESVNSE